MCVYVYVCVCAQTLLELAPHTQLEPEHMYVYVCVCEPKHMYVYVCVGVNLNKCMCYVYVCVHNCCLSLRNIFNWHMSTCMCMYVCLRT
jgi:hypothetical protein